jgi:hypothetical protein
MRATLLFAVLASSAASALAADLTATEMRWLRGGWPVVNYAKAQALPLDIIAQPQAKAGDAPLAMGFVDGRCKMVLAMRGNPEAESTLARIPPALLDPVVEAMFAHELGHCWRYVHGAWHTLPNGFVEMADDGMVDDQEIARLRRDMREARREEGFADLVGLAWTQEHHPGQYAAVHAWFEKVRADQPVEGAHHDTRAWLRLARERSAFKAGETPFERARGVWLQGLDSLP